MQNYEDNIMPTIPKNEYKSYVFYYSILIKNTYIFV